ncbi:MAG: hypothetical protein KF833_21905 [Verrucomicrobiae bacterium]|nr:hypothetical protein [Verrucomicrobiae bacterium]
MKPKPFPLRSLRIAALLILIATASASAQRAPSTARGVARAGFQGWTDVLRIESRDALPRAIVAPSVGGRVLFYGFRDDNLLWLDPSLTGSTLATVGSGFEPGGFQCAIGPEVEAIPSLPELSVGPWSWTSRRPYSLQLRAPEDRSVRVELEKDIVFDPATGDLGFVHRMKNTADRDSAYCLWHRIACQPGGFALLPVHPQSRFPAGWSIRRDTDRGYRYDGVQPESPDVRILDGVLVARTGGDFTQLGTDGTEQWLAYALGRSLFVIHFPTFSTAVYSEGGNTATITWDRRRTELQPLSPEARLRSRRTYEFPMKWALVELPSPVTSHEEARAVVSRIPGSPFQ